MQVGLDLDGLLLEVALHEGDVVFQLVLLPGDLVLAVDELDQLGIPEMRSKINNKIKRRPLLQRLN